jgi:hypothetical protein
MNAAARLLILGGILLFLGGGVALAVYLFSRGGPAGQKQSAGKDAGGANQGDGPAKDGPDRKDPTPPAKPGPRTPAPTLFRGQQLQVDKAVERGVAYLRSTRNADGGWTAGNDTLPNNPAGLTALVGLTLLECGAKKEDPAVQKVADLLRQREKSGNKIALTYELSLAILFLDRLDDPQDKELIQKLALRLVAGQTLSGGWTYGCPILSDGDGQILGLLLQKTRGQLTADPTTSKLVLEAVDPAKLRLDNGPAVPAGIANLVVWRNDVVIGANPDSDNSNTQFAILGLWAAKSRGLALERTLALVVARFHKSQNPDGSWGYEVTGPRKATAGDGAVPGGMTCAGLLGLAVGQGLVNEVRGKGAPRRKPAQQDPAIQNGLNFVARNIGDPHKPWENASGAPLVDMYFLWSVERVGVIFGLHRIGKRDWYGWGAEKLVANQKIVGDLGSWENGAYYGQNPIVNTCFALLFLKQANLAKDLTAKLALEE